MILFVCSQGKLRSRTAEILCLFGGLYARCGGTDKSAEAPVTDAMVRQASLIVCMEHEHKVALREFQHYGLADCVTLGIPDDYDRLNSGLIRSLIYQMSFHDETIAEAMERGYDMLCAQPGYQTQLGTHTPACSSANPAFSVLPQ